MKAAFLLLGFLLGSPLLWAQSTPWARSAHDSLAFNEALAPFYHGVASGDPLSDRVIIWTRVTPETEGPIAVAWHMATDTALQNVVASGSFTTDATRDYTVKVDVAGLAADQTYYYRFSTSAGSSIIGRTKTAPAQAVEQLKLAVVSCSNYAHGYFNAYDRLGARNDLDAIIHLGDYIYEYQNGFYFSPQIQEDRPLQPDWETVSLADYRTRYSLYRLDRDLMRAHQQHPFISVWDDHESANDAYKDGAQNHQPDTEGPWEVRKRASRQAYFEWLPIREQADSSIYRKFSYGELAEVFMLDTRIEGRDQQIPDVQAPELNDPSRSILGDEQEAWLKQGLAQSTAQWKVIGTQVLFSPFNVGFSAPTNPDSVESLFVDIWDGYPAERDSLIAYFRAQELKNLVFVAGDIHSSFGLDINELPTDTSRYNPATGKGSVAVEFVTPSITSANFDENIGPTLTEVLELCVNQPCPFIGSLTNPNPHVKFTDLDRHGYLILDLQAGQAQGDWFYVQNILARDTLESFGAGLLALAGEPHLRTASAPAPPKAVQAIPAPAIPEVVTSRATEPGAVAVLSVFPNPAAEQVYVHYALNEHQQLAVELLDLQGKRLRQFFQQPQPAGVYQRTLDLQGLAAGVYLLRFLGRSTTTYRLIKR